MIAVKFYSEGNDRNAPTTLPELVILDVSKLPAGYDQLFEDAEYKKYLLTHLQMHNEWRAAQPTQTPEEQVQGLLTLEDRLTVLETEHAKTKTDVAILISAKIP